MRSPSRPLQVIAAHAVLGVGVTDDRLDGGAPSVRSSLTWPLIQTRNFSIVIVAAITLVDVDATGLEGPVCRSSSAMTGASVWPSNGLPCSALGCSTNWPPFGLVAAGPRVKPNAALPLPEVRC